MFGWILFSIFSFILLGFVVTIILFYAFGSRWYVNMHNQEVERLKGHGYIRLSHVVVHETAKIYGYITAKHSTFTTFIAHGVARLKQCVIEDGCVYGYANFEKVTVNQSLEIYGYLVADDSMLNGVYLHVGRGHARRRRHAHKRSTQLNKTTVRGSISVEIEGNRDFTPVLHLRDTTVLGNIIFKGCSGEVRASGSTVIQGEVRGGVIVRL